MAWEWSHAPEAYEAARLNLYNLDPEQLREIFAEWKGYTCDSEANESDPCPHCYEDARAEAAQMTSDELAAYVWEQASHQRTCDNGGWNAWLCPYGCGCHVVPFDTEALDEYESGDH